MNLDPKTCSVIDERGEIAAMYKGVPQNDIGQFTDVIVNTTKELGINMLIRSMSPEVIICDEIGRAEDIIAIQRAVCSGVKGIFTVHADTIAEIKENENLKQIIDNKLIKKIIILDKKNKGKIKEIFENK